MTHSPILAEFSKTYLDVFTTPWDLTNPQRIFGPNALKVLDFWEFICDLGDEEQKEISKLYRSLDSDVRHSAVNALYESVNWNLRCAAWWAVINVTERVVFVYATWELIGEVKDPIFYNLIMSHKKD